MAEELKLTASPRRESGSGPAGRLRRQGLLPAVIYGEGQAAEAIQVKEHDMSQILRRHASGNVLVDVEVEGSAVRKVLLKEVQHHPVTGRLLHADFHSISMTERLRIEVPVELVGEAAGLTQGGILEQPIRHVELECLPADILEAIELDVSALQIGDTLTVGDLTVDPEKYEILTAPELAVASVAAPRVEEEPEEAAAEAAEGAAEPEVIREKKAEEEESEEKS